MRKLATIQKIKSVTPIIHPVEGTVSSLDLVNFESVGWQCVAKRGEFAVGDFAVYIEISSVVPEHPIFEFLRSKKFKVKTIRLLGVLSQGLALPIHVLGDFDPIYLEFDTAQAEWVEGADVTEIIGVTRYEAPQETRLNGTGRVRTFPSDLIPKTDETRLQSAPFILDLLHEAGAVISTLKIDGTSATYFWDTENRKLRVCSRNMEKMDKDESVYWLMTDKYPQIEKFCRENPNLALQGEIAGPGIQKNRLGLGSVEFFAFNLFDMQKGVYIPAVTFFKMMAKYEIQEAPILEIWREFDLTLEELIERAKGVYPGTDNPQEGIVLRPFYQETFSYLLGGRVSCKVINNDYLLGGGE